MEVNLICSKNIYKVIAELLSSRDFKVNDNSVYTVIERNYELPDGKIGILFDQNTLDYLIDLLDTISNGDDPAKDFILGRLNDKYEVLPLDDILFFESSGNDILMITCKNKYYVKDKLYELEKRLGGEGFVRVSKAHIVNILNVKEISPWFGGRLLINFKNIDDQIEVSKSYVKSFKDYLGM